jgi:SET domain-containing protein
MGSPAAGAQLHAAGGAPTAQPAASGGHAESRLRERVCRAASPIHGQGCFARIAFAPGDYIGAYLGPPARRNGTYVLWVSDDGECWHGRSGRNLLRWLNHSDRPNAAFEGFDLYALRAIAPGEEITFDYTNGDGGAFG